MAASEKLQGMIDAQQRADILTYGLRAIAAATELRQEIATYATRNAAQARLIENVGPKQAAKLAQRSWSRDGDADALAFRAYARQLETACALAEEYRGGATVAASDSSSASWWIRSALRQAKEELKVAKADLKTIGGIRQLRLALATGGGEQQLAAAA